MARSRVIAYMMRAMKTLGILLAVVSAALAARQATQAAEYEQNTNKTFQVSPGGEFKVSADRGTVPATTDHTDQAHVRVFRKVTGGTKAEAEELFRNHEVTLKQEGNNVIVSA